MLHWTAPQAIWALSMLTVAGLAVWRGRWEERTVAFGLVVGSLTMAAFQATHDFNDARLGGLILEIIYLAVLIWVVLRSAKWWPLWTAAFQLVGVTVYLARMADPKIGAAVLTIWSYLILIVVVIGTWQHRRDRPSGGKPSSPSIRRSAT